MNYFKNFTNNDINTNNSNTTIIGIQCDMNRPRPQTAKGNKSCHKLTSITVIGWTDLSLLWAKLCDSVQNVYRLKQLI